MNPDPRNAAPKIGAEQIDLLEKLCNACAVTGDESEVRAIVLEEVRPHAAEVKVDALGNVLVWRSGSSAEPRRKVMLAAHMDEVGMMLVMDDGDGLFRVETVGGLEVRQMAGKPVWVGREHIPGVIGAKPIHFMSGDDRRRAPSLESLRVDVGSGSTKARVGDRATFATRFQRIGPSLRGKALDDRLGVATMIELLKHAPPNVDLLLAFTVQEEIGLRGARVAAYTFDPHLAIVVDSTPANDLPAWDRSENTVYNCRLDRGPAIYLADSGTIADPRLARHLLATAEKHGLPYQVRQPGGGSTDASAIQRQREGVPSISISVPGRYAHTAAMLARLADWENTLALLYYTLTDLTAEIIPLSGNGAK
ncbi:MAG TPA: M20/M25/M40 family metallo-hydrolase [Anaerolineaceae bacterium]|nr:M20/M25/M40 family metallo-hydrolase [Anaerolineaceae bacterium]